MSVSLQVNGQTSFLRQGGEYGIVGVGTPGDQAHPAISVGRDGGYLVWQDNATASGRTLIKAQRLDAAFSSLYGSFQISGLDFGGDEVPQVALLGNGGAVVVWQRVEGAAGIFARFLKADGTFVGDEVRINPPVGSDHRTPKVAPLSNGGVVLIWSSFGADGSMAGVFGCIYSNLGVAVGEVFQVNQVVAFNQKDPSVAPLTDGGFVVTWVSEQQRFAGSVDVYGRLYSEFADPRGAEFRINTGNAMAMTPDVSGKTGGGFICSWMEMDEAVPSNNWDVVYAVHDGSGARVGAPARANSTGFGDQYSPKLSPTGEEHLLVWTSMGQDGYLEGVYGRFINPQGAVQGDEFRVNTATVERQQFPAVGADGAGRLVVVWSGWVKASAQVLANIDLQAQRFDAIRPVPVPAAPHVHGISDSSVGVAWSALHGFNLSRYEVTLDEGTTVQHSAINSLRIEGLAAGGTYGARVRYVLADGRVSDWSLQGTGTTWGADANGDGLPDDWQRLYFDKSPSAWPSPTTDTDGDGASDRAEFLAGTNPQDASSVLRSAVSASTGQLRFNWNTQPGMVYQVQVSTNLVDWSNVGPPRFAAGAGDNVPIEQTGTAGYYRVILVR